MTMYEQNREYVLRGLALREVRRNEETARQTAAERDAALDAAERDMHRDINFMSRWNEIEKKVVQATERREKKTAERKAAIRARVKRFSDNLSLYMYRQGIALIIASALTILFALNAISFWLDLTGLFLAIAFSISNYVAYATRNRKNR